MSEIFAKILKDKNGKTLNVGSKYQQPEWGVDTTTIVDILPEAEYTIVSAEEPVAMMTSPMPYSLAEGATYEVIYNGTSYNCVCYFYDDGTGGGNYMMGNITAAGVEGYPVTNEPFMFGYYHEKTAAEYGVWGMILPLDGSATFTLSIKGASNEVHEIPAKYVEHAPVEPLIVNITVQEPTINYGYKIDRQYKEIETAILSGRQVYLLNESQQYFVMSVLDTSNETIIFFGVDYQKTTDLMLAFAQYTVSVRATVGTVAVKRKHSLELLA